MKPLLSPDTGGGGWRFCWSWLKMQMGAASEKADGAGEAEGPMRQ